jgi:hypothetical protein
MKKIIFAAVFILVEACLLLAQVPNADPNYNPCPTGQTYDAGQQTCYVPFSQNPVAYLIFAGLFVLIIVAIFAGRPILKKLGVKSNKTSDSEGGIH